jgi:hypothetical protein
MSLSPGDRLDRYEVIELLGSGGMGEVYRARDSRLARDVALKVLRVDAGLGAEGEARLLREARAAASLSHVNVLAVYDVGEVREPEALRGLAYIAMELVVGRPLRSYAGDESIPLERRIGWLRDIGQALGAAHKAGIVHRDVKMENVMIRFDGVVKVLDFGIARRAAATLEAWSSMEGHSLQTADTAYPHANLPTLTGQGAVVGTPFYMAPEQLRGEELDARADQFGWGVVAYWLLTGEPPWRTGAEPVALLSEILSRNPPPPRSANPDISVGVSSAIMRSLEKQRTERFPSMAALIEALDAAGSVATGAATTTPPSSPRPRHPGREGSRARPGWRRARAALIAAGLVAAGGAAVTAWRARTTRAPAAGATMPPAAIAPAAECASNADCVRAHGGAAWHCHSRRHACVELASQDCEVHAEPGDPEADDAVWLGGMFPLSTDPSMVSEMRVAELARQDFAASLGSGAARTGALHARPIGLVVCDEGVDAMRAARHLANDVEAPAVLGFRSTASARETIPTIFLPNDVLSFITISQTPSLTHIPEPPEQPRLIWRSTLDRADSAAPLAHFISDVLEPAARAGAHGIGDRPLRVAVVWANAANHDTVESLFATLRFNGLPALENGANFRQFVYETAGDAGAVDVVGGLVAFSPQVIVFADRGFYSKVLLPLEASWPKGASAPRPVYLTTSGLSRSATDFAGRDASKRHRFFAVTNRSTTMPNAELVLRYNAAFPREPIMRTEAPQPSYDAFYVLAYATYALGDAPVTGPALSRSIERLMPPGLDVDVGPVQVGEAFEVLRSGGRIDLNGAIGALDFDPRTGEAPIDYAIVCMDVDDQGRAAATVDSGLFYDARGKKLVGALRCP